MFVQDVNLNHYERLVFYFKYLTISFIWFGHLGVCFALNFGVEGRNLQNQWPVMASAPCMCLICSGNVQWPRISTFSERKRCSLWIKKLCKPSGAGTGIVGRENRNLYAKLLLHMLQRGVLEGPFSQKPEEGMLKPLPAYMVSVIFWWDKPAKMYPWIAFPS